MDLWISKMYYMLFNVSPELLNANCLPPSFKLDQADGKLVLEPHLVIRNDTTNLSLQVIRYTVRIGNTTADGVSHGIG